MNFASLYLKNVKLFLTLCAIVLSTQMGSTQEINDCGDIYKYFTSQNVILKECRANKEYEKEDSITSKIIELMDDICPCYFDHPNFPIGQLYTKLLNISLTLKFHALNQREVAFDYLFEKMNLCENKNDTLRLV